MIIEYDCFQGVGETKECGMSSVKFSNGEIGENTQCAEEKENSSLSSTGKEEGHGSPCSSCADSSAKCSKCPECCGYENKNPEAIVASSTGVFFILEKS